MQSKIVQYLATCQTATEKERSKIRKDAVRMLLSPKGQKLDENGKKKTRGHTHT